MLLLLVGLAGAQETADPTAADAVVDVVDPRRLPTGCRNLLTRRDVELSTARDTPDLFLQVPGMFAGDHLGRGGFRDWAWRGVDLARGRGLEVTLDGIPLNAPGDLFGAGTVDLSFLPTLLVDQIDLCRGPSRPGTGAFGTTGSLRLGTAFPQRGGIASLGTGTDGSGVLTAAWGPKGWDAGTFLALQAEEVVGVGADRSYRNVRVAAGIDRTIDQVRASALIAFHDGVWDVPPALREADVRDRVVGFREGYRQWGGDARSRRLLVGVHVTRPWERAALDVHAWLNLQGSGLDDNRTGFLLDPVLGDGQRITQSTLDVGVRARGEVRFPMLRDLGRFEAGLEVRSVRQSQDRTRIDLEHEPVGTPVATAASHLGLAAFTALHLGFFDVVELTPALRIEQDELALADRDRPDEAPLRGRAFTWSPRASLRIHPVDRVEVALTYGRGHVPPDPTRLDGPDPDLAVVQDHVEADFHFTPLDVLDLDLAAFGNWSAEEVVYDLITGRELLTGATRRLGGEVSVAVRPLRWLSLKADGGATDARLAKRGEPVPYAPRFVGAIGLYADEARIRTVTLSGGLRLNYAGARPLPDGFSSTAAAWLDLSAALAWRKVRFDLAVDNLVPWDWTSSEYLLASRWEPQRRASPLPVRHLVAGKPFTLRLGFALWL